jgi:lysine 6-dehydrogenase
MKIIVLGCGLVGGPMAADLAADSGFEVTVADINAEALGRLAERAAVRTAVRDLADPETVRDLVRDFDLVLSAVPGRLGFQTLRAVIEAGRSAVDIAFFAEDPFLLEGPARERGATVVVDCGVAPGLSNLLAGHVDGLLDETRRILIYVGGLPEVREWPFEYKAVFSPADVIEEYIRPARFVEDGRVVTRPALSDPELLDFAGVGTLEAFNTDGLRTLARTLRAPFMKEKTLRYPGHVEKMVLLRETGFFSREEVDINGLRVRPLDVTSRLLFPRWRLKDGERDLTVLRLEIEGRQGSEERRFVYDLLDRSDPVTGVHSMARTTGYTATAAVRLLAQGLYRRPGINAPEHLGREPGCTAFILDRLRERGVICTETVGPLPFESGKGRIAAGEERP